MTEELIAELKLLADRYEKKDFLNDDPSQFIRWYSDEKDIEVASFIAALLSFGSRFQFIPKIKQILLIADKNDGIYNWIKRGTYKNNFNTLSVTGQNESNSKKYYRFYSYDDLIFLFDEINGILHNEATFGFFFQKKYLEEKKLNENILLSDIISNSFKSKIVPHGKDSANKRINMFLRWMVRTDSPVDIGIWDWYDKKNLLIPLDVHVINEAKRMGLISEKGKANKRTAIELSKLLMKIWPSDPCKGDFALFGLGINDKM